jgi:hypothetical protein
MTEIVTTTTDGGAEESDADDESPELGRAPKVNGDRGVLLLWCEMDMQEILSYIFNNGTKKIKAVPKRERIKERHRYI